VLGDGDGCSYDPLPLRLHAPDRDIDALTRGAVHGFRDMSRQAYVLIAGPLPTKKILDHRTLQPKA